jgi:bidirectional [NiFe] hydrogenase diaphorase subunit
VNKSAATVALTIDGRRVEVEEGATVLDTARALGIWIPTLCSHPAVEPYGACRLCMVEIVSGNRTRLTTSCTFPAREGLAVRTDSEGVLKARRFVIELLLARCPQAGDVRAMARRLGVEGTDLRSPGENDTCILCGLCVRVCRELIGANAIGFINRGGERAVETPFRSESDACIGCGACAFVCPTGAIGIEEAGERRALKTWHTERGRVRCSGCGELFAVKEVLDRLKEALALPEEVISRCPRCRRKRMGRELRRGRD